MVFDSTIKFYGTYRPYQQRVLDNLSAFLDNEKIHIVAAPGSGKTILGIELIKRLNQQSLILVPSIAIREQWIDRFANNFLLDKTKKDKWISNDIKECRPIICITYQSFYSAFKKEINNEIEDEIDEVLEKESFEDFDLLEVLKKYNIKTICLDECHHLKSEWWKALENVIKQLEGIKIISLTATPPYDSNPIEWQRYIDLCGPIDEEIFVPELIKDNNLCPHHDYIYFSYPTKDEEKQILRYYSNGLKTFYKYKNNKEFLKVVLTNKIYKNFETFRRAFYNDEDYYRALILYLVENGIKVRSGIKSLVHIEKLSISHFETLLQYVLFNDQSSYEKSDLVASMKKEFSALGVVHNREITLVHNEKINKIVSLSSSKLDSIKSIIETENSNPENNMKCLVLTDYIKMKSKSLIGNDEPIETIGAIPIFEYLRRQNIENVKLCCLSGSVCIIPYSCREFLPEGFELTSIIPLTYDEVILNNSNRKKLVSAITKLFEDGHFNVLIGTKSLLGEGWDSPCINTLIMASFIGSYVLSNQMRGRAIRTDKNNPNKISNIWHLVCLDPYDYTFSNDYYTLQKRFTTFLGIDRKQNSIESGIDRLDFPRIPYNSFEAKNDNKNTIIEAKNRDKTKEVWNNCINKAKHVDQITKVSVVSRKRLRKDYSFYSTFVSLMLVIAFFFVNFGLFSEIAKASKFIALIVTGSISIILAFFFFWFFIRFFGLLNPELKLYSIGKAILISLRKQKMITSKNIRVITYHKKGHQSAIYIVNASTYEQNLFSDCILQVLGEIRQPRYLVTLPIKFAMLEYYVIPDLFKKNKELAKSFQKELSLKLGPSKLIFAKNDDGRNIVLKAKKRYYFMFKHVEIHTKNVLLATKKELKKDKNI